MTHFIQEARELTDIAKGFQKLINLLEKPKSLSELDSCVSDLEQKLKGKDNAEKVIKKAAAIELEIKAQKEALSKLEKDIVEKDKIASQAKEDAITLKAKLEKEYETLTVKIKQAEAEKTKALSDCKKFGDKEAILDLKIKENDDLKIKLDASIISYNEAINNLKAAKVV